MNHRDAAQPTRRLEVEVPKAPAAAVVLRVIWSGPRHTRGLAEVAADATRSTSLVVDVPQVQGGGRGRAAELQGIWLNTEGDVLATTLLVASPSSARNVVGVEAGGPDLRAMSEHLNTTNALALGRAHNLPRNKLGSLTPIDTAARSASAPSPRGENPSRPQAASTSAGYVAIGYRSEATRAKTAAFLSRLNHSGSH